MRELQFRRFWHFSRFCNTQENKSIVKIFGHRRCPLTALTVFPTTSRPLITFLFPLGLFPCSPMCTALVFRFQQVDPFVSKSITQIHEFVLVIHFFSHPVCTYDGNTKGTKCASLNVYTWIIALLVSRIGYYNFCYLQLSRVSKLFCSPARRVSSFDFYVVAFLKFPDSVSFLEKNFLKINVQLSNLAILVVLKGFLWSLKGTSSKFRHILRLLG